MVGSLWKQGSLFLCVYSWLGWSSLPQRLSLVAEGRGHSLVAVLGLLIVVASLVAELGDWALRA